MMQNPRFFPAVQVMKEQDRVKGRIGFKVESFLDGRLLDEGGRENSQLRHPLNPKELQNKREFLLQALGAWNDGSVFELTYQTRPNILYQTRGKLDITLSLNSWAESEAQVKEKLIVSSLSLTPLLRSHLPEVSFTPLTTLGELEDRAFGIPDPRTVCIHRRKTTLDFSLQTGMRAVQGFGNQVQEVSTQSVNGHSKIEYTYPFLPSQDDWAILLKSLMHQLDPVRLLIRLKPLSPAKQQAQTLEQLIQTCDQVMEAHQDWMPAYRKAKQLRTAALKQQAEMAGTCFQLGIFVLTHNAPDLGLARVVGRSMSTSTRFEEEEDRFQGDFDGRDLGRASAQETDYVYEVDSFSVREAAAAFRLPSPPLEDIPGLPVQRARTCLAFLPEPSREQSRLRLFVNVHQGSRQPVYQSVDDRMKHTFVLGQTGTGKSTLLESMILQDIRAGHGLAVIDPHGDLVEPILGKIPKERSRDVIYFNMLDREYPPGFNLLEWKTLEERDMIVDDLYLTMDRLYDMRQTGGPMFESHFRNMLKLLMGDRHHELFVPTLLEFSLCYRDKRFRSKLKKRISDKQVIDFISEAENTEGEAHLGNVSTYITCKFNRFIQDTTLKRIIGQEKTSLDFEKVMNSGKILLVNMGKGRFGPVVSGLLANQLVTKFKLAAMKRGDLPVAERRFFFSMWTRPTTCRWRISWSFSPRPGSTAWAWSWPPNTQPS